MSVEIKRLSSFFLSVVFTCLLSTANGQVNVKDSTIFAPLFRASIGLHLPAADLHSRFGAYATGGGEMLFKLRSNWILGPSFHYHFGDQVKEVDMLNSVRSENGQIINLAGRYASVFYYHRGFSTFFHVGRVINVLGPNPNSGFLVTAGVGFWQHKIKLVDEEGGVFILRDEYLPGYDRMTSGLAFHQFIGYQFLGNNRVVNFFLGIEAQQGLTQNRRNYNFDLMGPDPTQRLDISYGLKFGWIIPFYKKTPQEFYVY